MTHRRSIRQSFLGSQSEAAFARAVVAVVGVCGGGSHVAQQLAYVGFRNLRLFDPDHIEEPNLNRMVGSAPSDAARKKTEVIRDQVLRIQPGANVEGFPCKWQEEHVALRESSIVFGCVDSFGQRDELEAYCRRFLIPYIDIGMDVHELSRGQFSIGGQVITSLPGEPCMRCMGFITEERIAREAERYGDAGDRPQVVWPNGILASTAVGIGVSLLTPWYTLSILMQFIEYDGNRHVLQPSSVLSIVKGGECPHYPADAVGDPFWQPKGKLH